MTTPTQPWGHCGDEWLHAIRAGGVPAAGEGPAASGFPGGSEMSDISDRLRRYADLAERRPCGAIDVDYVLLRNAAAELGRLRADNASLREALAGVRSMHADALEECQRLQAGVTRKGAT